MRIRSPLYIICFRFLTDSRERAWERRPPSSAVVRRRPFPLSYAAMFPLLRQAVIKDLLNSSGVHPVNNCSLLTYRDSYYFVE